MFLKSSKSEFFSSSKLNLRIIKNIISKVSLIEQGMNESSKRSEKDLQNLHGYYIQCIGD